MGGKESSYGKGHKIGWQGTLWFYLKGGVRQSGGKENWGKPFKKKTRGKKMGTSGKQYLTKGIFTDKGERVKMS